MRRLGGTILLAAALIAPTSAHAAIVGSGCEANAQLVAGIEGIVFPYLDGPPAGPSTSISPTGVATHWTVRSGSTDTFYERLKVLHRELGSDSVQVVTDTPLQPIAKGAGSFPIRIPVQSGDRFGLSGPMGVSVCTTGSVGDVIGTTSRNGQPGQSERFTGVPGYQLALSVTVEPDADADGYGDETQDGCPEVSSVQRPCPRVAATMRGAVRKRAILVGVRVTSEASVQVFGEVRWKVQSQPSAKGAAHPGAPEVRVGLSGGGSRTASSTNERTFRLPLGEAVMRRLDELDFRKALKAKLTARITDVAGRVTDKRLRVRLPGRGRTSASGGDQA